MALKSDGVRAAGYDARHFRQGGGEDGEPPMSGVARLMKEEDERAAVGDDDSGESDIPGAVVKLREEIAGLRQDNKRDMERMDKMLYEMRGMVDRIEAVYADARDEEHSVQQAVLNGVNKAQQQAEEITLKNINEATERSRQAIDKMAQESKRRIERLAMITLPDRMFHFLKWTALMLALFIMVHIVWQMF